MVWLRLRRMVRDTARRVARLWQTSLQFRVVAITVLMGLAVVFMVGSYLYQSIADGLTNDRISQSREDAAARAQSAQLAFTASDSTDVASMTQLATDTVALQASQGEDRSRQVILTPALGSTRGGRVPTIQSGPVEIGAIPADLRAAVTADQSHQKVKIIEIPDDERGTVPATVIGSVVTIPGAGEPDAPYELYFVYPMQREQDSLEVVSGTFLFGGLALVVLLGAIAFVVARIVVHPLRRAATVAERLSSGHLNERMSARGRDDIARLAKSFNEMAANLQHQIVQLEDLSRVQQRFVSDVSHELRTPLTTIRMAGDLIHDSRDEFDPSVSRSAELLHNELDRFEALLADLLEISRFDAGAAALDAEPHDVRDLAARAVDSAGQLAMRRGVHIVYDPSPRPCVAEVDPRRIDRILRNLVVNAVEHAEGRPVVVRVGVNATAVAVTVRDQGVGLRPGESEMVFTRFWRADPARARTTGGTGLGLAIALEDARLHDGWLQAWGAPAEGSCFRLTVPRRAEVPIDKSPLPLGPDDPAAVGTSQPGSASGGPSVPPVAPRSPQATTDTASTPMPGHPAEDGS